MSVRMISNEEDGNAAVYFEADFIYDGDIKDIDEDEIEDEDEDEGEQVEDVDFRRDGTLFPNICDGYEDSLKWQLKLYSKMEPMVDGEDKPPLQVVGYDPYPREWAVYDNNRYPPIGTGGLEIGQQLELVSLLSDYNCPLLRVAAAATTATTAAATDNDYNYVPPETLLGKYVVFVCVFAPTRWVGSDSKNLCQLRTLSQQLSEAENFEMVFIVKMRKGYEHIEAAFDHLLSAFRGCLYVPFRYEAVRDEICYVLEFRGSLEAILVDTTHKVAQFGVPDIVANYYYPSHKHKTDKIKYLSPNWIRPSLLFNETERIHLSSSLAWLLDASYGDPTLRLHNLSFTETITVGSLDNKLVGLYIFKYGDKLKSLLRVYQQCMEKGLDFNIVVVFASLSKCVDPVVFHRVALSELQRLVPDKPWWVLPYNAATFSTLYQLCGTGGTDGMIVVGPRKKFFVDVYGGDVLHSYGIQAYPFNREMIVRKYELGAKAITLDSLLCADYVYRGRKRVPVSSLYDKVVVIYTHFSLGCDTYGYNCLKKWYKEIRKQHSDFEVVFVYFDKPEDDKVGESESSSERDIDFLMRRFDSKHSELIRNHESFFSCNNGHGFPAEGLYPDQRLLFGKGGRLCALNALQHFEQYGLVGYPYENGCGENYIRDEIILSLAMQFRNFMSSYGSEKPYDVVSLE